MVKKVRITFTVENEKHLIRFSSDVSKTSKLALADWIWFGKNKFKECYKENETKITINYIQPGEKK